jgi:Carboxypeptidase regulatory-like domain
MRFISSYFGIKPLYFGVIVCFALPPAQISCQGVSTIQYAKPFVVQQLAGTVIDTAESPIANARVEVCEAHWRNCTKSTVTNRRGEFSFSALKKAQLFYLRLSSPGFNPLEVKVKINRRAKRKLALHMTVAT